MADPRKYTQSAAFSGSLTPSGTQLDIQFADISESTEQFVDALKDVRRSDGGLVNGIVTVDSLAEDLSIGFTLRGSWKLNTMFAVGDGVVYDDKFYRCRVTHTATADNQPGLDPKTWEFLLAMSRVTGNLVALPPGYLYGLSLSNNATHPTRDVDIAAGEARDGTNNYNLVLPVALTKRMDASWAPGTDEGMLDEPEGGAPDIFTWYHVHLIERSDTAISDVLASKSATAPTMPEDYDYGRRLGAVYINGSGKVEAFEQDGDKFRFTGSGVADRSSTDAASDALLTLTVPTGVAVRPTFVVRLATDSDSTVEMSVGDGQGATANLLIAACSGTVAAVTAVPVHGLVRTNASGQIRIDVGIDAGSILSNTLTTHGWIDRRGRDG